MDALIGMAVRAWWGVKHVRVFERATIDPEAAQRHKLLAILRRNQDTVFGRQHRFATLGSVDDFQRGVPVRDYTALEPFIEEMRQGRPNVLTLDPPMMYAMTSGTTVRPKYIPVTRSYLHKYLHGTNCSFTYALRAHPAASHRVLTLTSAADTERAPSGVPCGAISGYLTERQPRILQRRFAVPPGLTRIEDVDARYYLLLRLALMVPLSRLEVGRTYYILFTTSAGLYRYHINDIIRVTGFYGRTPIIEFVRKGMGTTSIAGEKLTDAQVAIALDEGRRQTGVPFVHCTAAPLWGDPPYYGLFLEPNGAVTVEGTGALAAAVDQALGRLNIEYLHKRKTQRLGPPVVRIVPAGAYEQLFKRLAQQGGPDMQIKLPVLSADLDFQRYFASTEVAASDR